MGLGLNEAGNTWKYAVINFVLIFGVQIVFGFNELMSQPESWPTCWFMCKTILSSLVTTLIFSGYNKLNQKA